MELLSSHFKPNQMELEARHSAVLGLSFRTQLAASKARLVTIWGNCYGVEKTVWVYEDFIDFKPFQIK